MAAADPRDLDRLLLGFSLNENPQSSLFPSSDPTPATRVEEWSVDGLKVKKYVNEFWTSRQRQAASIHEIAYRGCFKPQLPRFFIERLTDPGDLVYDPFSGRGTTAIEAALLERRAAANDVNPLSRILSEPRLSPPDLDELEKRLTGLDLDQKARAEFDLSMFYHPDTEGELVSLRNYLASRKKAGLEDPLDAWIRMIATNRLTGHSRGFFSVYTLPPNQAVSPERQVKINAKRKQKPDYRDVRDLILRKTKRTFNRLAKIEIQNLTVAGPKALFLTRPANDTPEIEPESVSLIVTSPPFLNVVQYAADNWLRCWFNGLDAREIGDRLTTPRNVDEWSRAMGEVFIEFGRILKPGGWVAFEVGEVNKSQTKLDEHVAPLGSAAGMTCAGILINQQEFTKTSNIWGVGNNSRGTNTNRVVMFQKKKG